MKTRSRLLSERSSLAQALDESESCLSVEIDQQEHTSAQLAYTAAQLAHVRQELEAVRQELAQSWRRQAELQVWSQGLKLLRAAQRLAGSDCCVLVHVTMRVLPSRRQRCNGSG